MAEAETECVKGTGTLRASGKEGHILWRQGRSLLQEPRRGALNRRRSRSTGSPSHTFRDSLPLDSLLSLSTESTFERGGCRRAGLRFVCSQEGLSAEWWMVLARPVCRSWGGQKGIWVPGWWHLALRQVTGPAVGWEQCALLELWQVSKDWGLGLGKQNCFCVPKPELTPAPSSLQNRPSVITCASASARNCNLSHCPIAHSGCVAGPASYRRTPSCKCP